MLGKKKRRRDRLKWTCSASTACYVRVQFPVIQLVIQNETNTKPNLTFVSPGEALEIKLPLVLDGQTTTNNRIALFVHFKTGIV